MTQPAVSLGVGNGSQIIIGIVFERNDTAIGSDVLKQIVFFIIGVIVLTTVRMNMSRNVFTLITEKPFFGMIGVNNPVSIIFRIIQITGFMAVSISYDCFTDVFIPSQP